MNRHRLGIAFLVAAAAASHSLAVGLRAEGEPPINCRPCGSSGDVVLMIGLPFEDYRARTETRLWIEKHSVEAQRRLGGRPGQTVRVVTQYPASVAEFRREVQRLADRCERIAYLGIISHGNAGYLQIGRDGVTGRNMEDAFGRGLGCVMAPDASVEIAGCNIGRGCSGAGFMLAAARLLLLRGGTITAPDSYVYGNAFLGVTPRPIRGDRELQVSAGALHPRWTKGSERGPECGSR